MRLIQLTFRGLFGTEETTQLSFGRPLNRPPMPEAVSTAAIRAIFVHMLYPVESSSEDRRVLERHSDPRVALTIEKRGRTFRVARQAADGSVRLQRRAGRGFETLRTGAEAVGKALRERFGRPELHVLRALNFWDWSGAAAAADSGSSVDLDALGPEAVEMVREYRQTLELDRLEGRLAKMERSMRAIRSEHEEAFEVESELSEARSQLEEIDLPELDDESFELVRESEERLAEFEAKLSELREREEAERRAVDEVDPDAPWRQPSVWAGLTVGIASMAASFFLAHALRWVALLSPVAFGVVTWYVLAYLTDREELNVRKVRVESIGRRESEARREMIEFREEVDHLLTHAGVESREELLGRKRESERLEDRVARLEDRAERLADTEEFREAKSQLEELRERYDRLQERREELPEFGADIFQLENGLHALGIDPERVRDDGGIAERTPDHLVPFALLRRIAEERDHWTGGELSQSVRRSWRAMASRLLDEKFGDVFVNEQGAVGIEGRASPEAFGGWLESHRRERSLLAASLALALYRSIAHADRVGTLIVPDPGEVYPDRPAEQLVDLLRNVVEGSHVILLPAKRGE